MSEQDNNANHIDPTCPALMDCWTSSVQQSAENAQEVLVNATGSTDPSVWRRHWFDHLGQSTDAFLRSPLFLQMLKSHLDALIHLKQAEALQPDNPPSTGGAMNDNIQAMWSQLQQIRQQLDQIRQQFDSAKEMLRGMSDPPNFQQAAGSQQTPPAEQKPIKGVTASEVVYQEGLLKLLRYRNDSVKFAEPILICFALVNRPYILDLQDNRSVVRRLLDRGFDVYLIDWGVPDATNHQLRLEDYVCRFLRNVVDFVCGQTSSPQLSLLGYCMGGTMSTMFTALHPQHVRNLILMATPIDFAGDEGLLNLWAREDYFDVDKLVDAFGNCPGEFLQFVFQLMKPVQNFAEKQLHFSENLDDAAFVDNFVALERWANDSIPVVGETFRQYVKSLYQQNRLVKGQMCLAGEPVRLEAIACPLLLLVAENDHLVPPGSTLALKHHVSSTEVESNSINAGHIGLAVSSKAHRNLWPQAADWIANHSTEL